MPGRVIKGENNLPVARIMACLEVVMRVGLATDVSDASAFVSALLERPMARVTTVCDNRDFFQLRPIGASDVGLVQDAVRVGCGVERAPIVDWATVSYFDNPDSSAVPDTYVACAVGRCLDADRDVALSLVVGHADSSPWDGLFQLADRLAAEWPGVWCSITVGNRFCPLDYNGFPFAHQAIHRMAGRMPSVDVGDTLGIHTALWTRRLRTVAWTTFVAREFEARYEAGRLERSNRVHVQRLTCGGTCVRVRDEPAESHPPETELKGYIQADGILRAVRASVGIAFLPPWNERTSREWLGRWQAGGTGSMFISTPG